MHTRILTACIAALGFVCLASQSAVAQEKREPQGSPLPPYARRVPVADDRVPDAPVIMSRSSLPNIMVTGFWPPTNEMLRPFSTNPTQNPDGWVGENWQGRYYNVYAFFPEFPQGLGKGEGDFEVDYQDTSADWWRIVAEVNPVAIITFGRADNDYDWELEGSHQMIELNEWLDDYLTPFIPTPELPIAGQAPGTQRWSTLPLDDIVDAVTAAVPSLLTYSTEIDGSAFLCDFIGYHATWYHELHAAPTDPGWNVAAGHIHVGYAMELDDAIRATEVTLQTLIEYLDTQLPVRGDFDDDRDVDDYDLTQFHLCYSGPGGGLLPGCEPADFDGDSDVDCDDWEAFKTAWTGPPTYPAYFIDCDADCNANAVADEFDIAMETSEDCNGNVIPDECESGCENASEADLADGATVTLNPGGGSGVPTDDALVRFSNQSGADGASITVNETTDPVHVGAQAYSVFGTALVVQPSLADGEFFMTVAIPFDDADLLGADPLSVNLAWYDEMIEDWKLAVTANTQPSPGHEPSIIGDRFADSGTVTPGLDDLSTDLGDYGVFWNTGSSTGFAWANVDHATDFTAGIRTCSTVKPRTPAEDAGTADRGFGTKNRYLSFDGTGLDPLGEPSQHAIRVTFVTLPGHEYAEGRIMWVQEPYPVGENSGSPDPGADNFFAARLGCEPTYVDWSEYGMVDVFDDAIIPRGSYDVQAIDVACATDSASYSDPLTVAMSGAGDVVGNNLVPPPPESPQGVIDFNDISALVDKFRNLPSASRKARADVVNSDLALARPDQKIDFVDISCTVDSFRGTPCAVVGPPATDPCQ